MENIKSHIVSFLVGSIVSVIALLTIIPAQADKDQIQSVRASQSNIHDAATKVSDCLEESLKAVGYIKEEVKNNARLMDFPRD